MQLVNMLCVHGRPDEFPRNILNKIKEEGNKIVEQDLIIVNDSTNGTLSVIMPEDYFCKESQAFNIIKNRIEEGLPK